MLRDDLRTVGAMRSRLNILVAGDLGWSVEWDCLRVYTYVTFVLKLEVRSVQRGNYLPHSWVHCDRHLSFSVHVTRVGLLWSPMSVSVLKTLTSYLFIFANKHEFWPCGFFFLLSFFLSIIFSSCRLFYLSSSSFFLSCLSRRRLDVCHTSTHGVALVRI